MTLLRGVFTALLLSALTITTVGASPASAQVSDGRDSVVPESYARARYDGAGASSSEVVPTVTCYVKLQGNQRRTYFGYTSTYAADQNIPIGFWNWVAPAPAGNGGQPTTFVPGAHDAVFSIDHASGSNQYWYLDWSGVGTKQAKQCKDDQVPVVPNPAIGLAFLTVVSAGIVGQRRLKQGQK